MGPALCGRWAIHLTSIWVSQSMNGTDDPSVKMRDIWQPIPSFHYNLIAYPLHIFPARHSQKWLLHPCRRGSRSRTCKRSSTTRIPCLASRQETTIPTNTRRALAIAINPKSSPAPCRLHKTTPRKLDLACIQRELPIRPLLPRDMPTLARMCIECDQLQLTVCLTTPETL